MHLEDLVTPESLITHKNELKKIGEKGGIVYETVHRRKDGTIFPGEVSMRLLIIEWNEFYQTIIRDISDRKKKENGLYSIEEHFKKLIEHSSDPILIVSGGMIKFINSSCMKLLGVFRSELVVDG
jgi:PAS domain-containing protein